MNWQEFIEIESNKEYHRELTEFLNREYSEQTIFPESNNIYRAFWLTEYSKTKVVILGQDPYHNIGQADGLAFSVYDGIKKPPSLRNILKEYNDDLGYEIPESGDLTKWAKQGVLLINACLTVRHNAPLSHNKKGWEIFTDNLIKHISNNMENVVFVLWGGNARKKKKIIDLNKHFVVESAHPSPLSAYRGFFGSKPFTKINNYLKEKNIKEIDWKL